MEINEQKLKDILGEHKKDTEAKIDIKFNELKKHFDIVREDFDSKVQLITEQYDSIIEKLDSHEERLISIEERLGRHEMRLVSIEKNIEIMKVDIVFIKNGLKKKVDVEEFEVLENRMALLEAKLQN